MPGGWSGCRSAGTIAQRCGRQRWGSGQGQLPPGSAAGGSCTRRGWGALVELRVANVISCHFSPLVQIFLEVIFPVLTCTVFVVFLLILEHLGVLSCVGTVFHVLSKRWTAANDYVKHVTEVRFPRKKLCATFWLPSWWKKKLKCVRNCICEQWWFFFSNKCSECQTTTTRKTK